MRALVVYESMFGNTRAIAEAIAAGLSTGADADLVEVGDAPDVVPDGVDLLVVGGPTHAFGLSRPQTRQDAAGRAATGVVSGGRGLREWLEVLGAVAGREPAVATFDTRIRKPRVPGSAAKAAAKRLRHLGLRLVRPAETFWVGDVQGPLGEGELERARVWGEELAIGSAKTVSPWPARR